MSDNDDDQNLSADRDSRDAVISREDMKRRVIGVALGIVAISLLMFTGIASTDVVLKDISIVLLAVLAVIYMLGLALEAPSLDHELK